jgi:putative transposase
MMEAGKQFRRLDGHLHPPTLRDALNRHVSVETAASALHDEQVIAA